MAISRLHTLTTRVAIHSFRLLPVGVTAVHAFLTGILFWWAFTLATPPETFPTAIMYQPFERTWPFTEPRWAAVFLVLGLFGLAGLLTPLRRPWLRLQLAAFLAFVHVVLAGMVHDGNPAGTSWGVYVLCALLGMWRLLSEGSIKWVRD